MKRLSIQWFSVAIPLLTISLLAFFWSQLAPSLPLTQTQILGLGLGALFAAFLYFDSKISEIISQPKEAIINGSANKCFDIVLSKMSHVKHLRIFGNSTIIVQPAIANSSVTIKKCEILIREVKVNERLKEHIGDMIKEWQALTNKKRIDCLKINGHDCVPTEWYVIFDDEFLICGLNIPRKDEWKEVEILSDATLIQNRSIETKTLIKKYIFRFDEFFEERSESKILYIGK